MTHTISIYYFPKGMRYTAALLLLASCYLFYIEHWLSGILSVLIITFILTAQYITTIDLGHKDLSDAFSFFGVKLVNERRKFTTLDKIIITKGNYNQKISTRFSDRQLNWSDYTGILIYDGNDELELLTREDKSELVNALKVYATALRVTIEDQSSSRSQA